MKNNYLIGALVLSMGIALPASAEVQEECILTGRIERSQAAPEAIRVNFYRMEHGEQARCRAKGRRGGLARLRFEPKAGDALAQLDHGTEVHYRYQMRHNERHWYRMDSTQLQVSDRR